MALTPAEFANLYVPVSVEDEEWFSYPVYVGKYRNAQYNVDLAFKDTLLEYLMSNRGKPNSGIVLGPSNGYAIPDCGVRDLKLPTLMHAFCGKALPADVAQVISVFSHWHTHSRRATSSKYRTLQGFADGCLGTDCNGLVGGFFKSVYPATGYEPSTYIGSYDSQGTKRKTLADLRALDVLIFPNYAHIAIIDRVTNATSDKVECTITQSRSQTLGGAQTGAGTITLHGHAFHLNATPLHSIVKARGMPS